VDGALEAFDFRSAAEALLHLAEAANGFLNERAPWKQIKQEDGRPQVGADLYAVLETTRWVALLLAPLLPDLSARLLSQLGLAPFSSDAPAAGGQDSQGPHGWTAARCWGKLSGGHPLPEPIPVMQRLELDSPL